MKLGQLFAYDPCSRTHAHLLFVRAYRVRRSPVHSCPHTRATALNAPCFTDPTRPHVPRPLALQRVPPLAVLLVLSARTAHRAPAAPDNQVLALAMFTAPRDGCPFDGHGLAR
ncbi:hypothetical protein DFH09DRAFT_1311951 [Mycena vulgaris]|nr:hypothetical protein DFH09DRAFT_1311951 [Mycena vulgaris]